MNDIYERIRSFWNSQPCGTTHIHLPPHSKEYFIEFDKYFERLYPYLMPWLDLESLRGKDVLEIGLGSGFTLHRIDKVAKKTWGLDISDQTIQLNQARKEHFGANFELLNASATSIPLPDNSLDAVISIGCLHHIPDIQMAIDEIHRVLKPEALFKGMVYNRNSWRFLVYITLLRQFHPKWRGKSSQDCVSRLYDGSDNPYGMVYSKAQFVEMLRGFANIRFQVENFYGNDFLPGIGNAIPRNFWLATLGKVAGLDLYFSASAVK